MRRLVVAPRAAETVALMQDAGILPIVLGGVGYVAQFARLVAFEGDAGAAPCRRDAARGACLPDRGGCAPRSTERLRLANAERDRIAGDARRGALRSRRCPTRARPGARSIALGAEAYRDGVAYAFAWSGGRRRRRGATLYALPDRWTAPKFPLGGRDIIGAGVRGPAVGELLRAVEAWWIDRISRPTRRRCAPRLQQMMAAAQ